MTPLSSPNSTCPRRHAPEDMPSRWKDSPPVTLTMRAVGEPGLDRSSNAGEADFHNKPRKPELFLPSKCRPLLVLIANAVRSGASRRLAWWQPPQFRDQPDSPRRALSLEYHMSSRSDRSPPARRLWR